MNPLTLRQSFQTANLEALREAQGVHELQARDAAHRRNVDDQMTQEQNNVPLIPKADAMRTEERQGRQQPRGKEKGESPEEGDERESWGEPAIPAEGHLDFLA
ncbi:hypothetical protein [Mesoterricola silvestris]|uniref:Uncharacterized protein n=1 Tax=Mesoterricola silvestris TaxID=2927979 RepID=A0AA48GL25_9BACT|nr:hypothetical protein [Mesoterricola silvestris]BDU73347.1 hypothetical protein METEAL_25210 [Mesoterricola silvestris]